MLQNGFLKLIDTAITSDQSVVLERDSTDIIILTEIRNRISGFMGGHEVKCFVALDCYADIIDIPDHVAIRIKKHRNQFLNWIYNKNNNHGYWVKASDGKGGWFYGVQYGSDAFVDWLNTKVIKDSNDKAVVVERNLDISEYKGDMPYIFF